MPNNLKYIQIPNIESELNNVFFNNGETIDVYISGKNDNIIKFVNNIDQNYELAIILIDFNNRFIIQEKQAYFNLKNLTKYLGLITGFGIINLQQYTIVCGFNSGGVGVTDFSYIRMNVIPSYFQQLNKPKELMTPLISNDYIFGLMHETSEINYYEGMFNGIQFITTIGELSDTIILADKQGITMQEWGQIDGMEVKRYQVVSQNLDTIISNAIYTNKTKAYLKLYGTGGYHNDLSITVNIIRDICDDDIQLIWLNSLGGVSTHLFRQVYTYSYETRQGEIYKIENGYSNTENETDYKIDIKAKVSRNDFIKLESLAYSDEVYMSKPQWNGALERVFINFKSKAYQKRKQGDIILTINLKQ